MTRVVVSLLLACAMGAWSVEVSAQACVRSSEDLEVPLIRVEAGARTVTMGLEHARLSIDAATSRAEVSRPLELVGVASVAWRTSQNIEIERAIFVPAGTAVQPGAREGALRVSGPSREHSLSWSGVPVRCEALELGPPRPPPGDWESAISADRPTATGVTWAPRASRLELRTRPDAGATIVSLGGLGSWTSLTEVAREGSWVRLLVRLGGGVEIRGWVQVVDLEPPPSGGGALGSLGGGRCEPPTLSPAAFEGDVELPLGLTIHASPGGASWARVPVATRAHVRYEVGVVAGGEEWARLVSIEGVRALGGTSRCPSTELSIAHVRADLLPIPDLAALRARARAAEPQPIGAEAVRAARTDRGLTPSRFALGRDHGCVLVGGRVRCWGDGAHGQLGDGTTASRDEAREVPGLEGVIEIASADAGVCALLADGAVSCWGSLGDRERLVPTRVAGIDDAVAIGGDIGYGCAVRADGRVACWGRAPGDTTPAEAGAAAYELHGVGDAIAIAGGTRHACVLRAGGELVCWGDNGDRQLGVTGAHPRPTAVPPLTDVVRLAAFGARTCAIVRGGSAHCWGSAYGGSLGIAEHPRAEGPTPVIDHVDEIALGGSFVCFRREDATTACFASYSDRELLAGGASGPRQPVTITGPRALAMGAADAGACVLDDAGGVWCWGARTRRGSVAVPDVTDATFVAAGYRESCAVRAGGVVACWPIDPYGPRILQTGVRTVALGAGQRCTTDAASHLSCDLVGMPLGWDDVGAFDLDTSLVCAVVGGRVRCSARSSYGDGPSGEVPDDVLGAARDVAVHGSRVCVAEESGRVVCWTMAGEGSEGAPPEVVLSDAIDVDVAYDWGCARTRSGALQCFAAHGPRELRGLRGARDLSIGGMGACVVRAEGDVACFSYDRGGLSGTGARFTRPTIVVGTRGATQVSVGDQHACARLESGAVRCWGTATGGRVDGNVGPARVPGT